MVREKSILFLPIDGVGASCISHFKELNFDRVLKPRFVILVPPFVISFI